MVCFVGGWVFSSAGSALCTALIEFGFQLSFSSISPAFLFSSASSGLTGWLVGWSFDHSCSCNLPFARIRTMIAYGNYYLLVVRYMSGAPWPTCGYMYAPLTRHTALTFCPAVWLFLCRLEWPNYDTERTSQPLGNHPLGNQPARLVTFEF